MGTTFLLERTVRASLAPSSPDTKVGRSRQVCSNLNLRSPPFSCGILAVVGNSDDESDSDSDELDEDDMQQLMQLVQYLTSSLASGTLLQPLQDKQMAYLQHIAGTVQCSTVHKVAGKFPFQHQLASHGLTKSCHLCTRGMWRSWQYSTSLGFLAAPYPSVN